MQRFDLVEKLKESEDRVTSLLGDIRAFVIHFVDTHRKFKNGVKVEVFDEFDKSYGIGFIRSAQCGVSFRWGFRTHDYIGKEDAQDRWIRDLCDIMYDVVKMKKDGSPSERSLLWDKPRQEKRKGHYYLIPVE